MNQYTPDCPIALHLHSVNRKCPFRKACIRSDKGIYPECGYKQLKKKPKVDNAVKVNL